jgi:hypothetical protein
VTWLLLFFLQTSSAAPTEPSLDVAGLKVTAEVRTEGTALVAGTNGGPAWLEDFAAGSKIQEMTNFKAAGHEYVSVDFFNGYRGTRFLQSCWTAYIYRLAPRNSLIRVDRLTYRCDASGRDAPDELSFRISYHVDKKTARLVHGKKSVGK